MKLTPAELDALAAACTEHLHPGRLETAARQYQIAVDIDAFIKAHSAGRSSGELSVARAILDALNELEIACDLAERLYFEMDTVEAFQAVVGPLTRSAKSSEQAHQAFLRRRDHSLTVPRLKQLNEEIGPRVCCIVGDFLLNGERKTSLGTGFLVGPDIILTAMHVVDLLVLRHKEAEVPRAFKAVFDFESGDPIAGLEKLSNARFLRIVDFHATDWLRAKSDKLAWDGTVKTPDQTQIGELKSHLDFALIRLAEPVGNQPVRPGAARPRGWIETLLPPATSYADGARVIIPQHPFGFARRVDFGAISKCCESGTRMVSRIETEEGTSGAPCFAWDLTLIGVHNAAFKPNKVLEGNQAIRFDAIWPAISAVVPQAPPPPLRKRTWRLGRRNGGIAPILGRTKLQDWLNAALTKATAATGRSRSDRVYAADAPSLGAGKTFTVDVVRSILASEPDDIVIVLGGERELLPDRLEDFVVALAAGFGLTIKHDEIPEQPSAALPRGDGDKIDRWASQRMPSWFAERLAAHRVTAVNKSQHARAAKAGNDALGVATDAVVLELANAVSDVIEPKDRWRNTWIMIDDLNVRPMSAQVRGFVAGLVGADVDESAIIDVRASLYWLFLGATPDFLVPDDFTKEALSADDISVDDVAVSIGAAFDEAEITDVEPPSQIEAAALRNAIPVLLDRLRQSGINDETFLTLGQQLVARHIESAYQRHGRTL
ncbi:hypothetical protein MesoLjLc_46070 [Mesorhizobium sp. L-8-10]|uniref:trypsin-like serine peptidase n=1 Tax=unclassified Mesorhizobium TaxID=325217 RepID=UPI0019272AF4|nr:MULTISPECIES: serine protease [unclassified Mesorhizobium]BCH24888.1 hypothetical protein MesoLjLb_46730 [Mesorhizobium sp. L-8-3]BCH32677.1 hypothetical protein MesoLjLc_46070 [Mesorhizobium sp. L-8-10]